MSLTIIKSKDGSKAYFLITHMDDYCMVLLNVAQSSIL